MSIKQVLSPTKINGKDIFSIQMTNNKGTMVEILNYGAIIQRFLVKNKYGRMQDIVLGFDTVADYIAEDYMQNYCYFGAIIGRYANRIAGGKFNLNNTEIQIQKNIENATLHGGNEGFDKKVWRILPIADASQNEVTLTYISAADEEGFPGNLQVFLTFRLTDDDALELNFKATTDALTAINLTHHSYFNLSENLESIHHHLHQMNAHEVLQQDDNYCVTGLALPLENTHHDFRKVKKIAFDWDSNEGYDQSYVLDKKYKEFALATQTSEAHSGLCLSVYSDQPVAHLYTAKYLDVKNGKNGKNYGSFGAFCVETQHHPNAVNVPNFPSTLLHPDEIYTQKTVYKISVL